MRTTYQELAFAQGEYLDNLDSSTDRLYRARIGSAVQEYANSKLKNTRMRKIIDWGNKGKRLDIDKQMAADLATSEVEFLKQTGTILRGLKL